MTALGQFSRGAKPENVRGCLLAYYRMRDAALKLREENAARGASLRDRIALAGVLQDIDAGIVAARRWLSRYARRGVLVAGGHGDASPAPTTLVHLQESAHSKRDRSPDAAPANPLLLGLRGQELPERGTLNHTQTHEGHVSHG